MKVQFLGLVFVVAAAAQSQSIRATITGQSGGDGKCTFEVEVDGAAEVEIRGDRGSIRQLSGQTARWRRLTCTQPLPNNPGSFRFKGIDGRGRQQLVRDPNSTGGVAVIRIEDPKGGAEGYTGDIEWRGGNNNFEGVGNWNTGRDPNPAGGNWNRRISNNDAMRICKNQVIETRNVQSNRVNVRYQGGQQGDGDHRISFTFRNANGLTKTGFCDISGTGQILQLQVEGSPNANRTSWNQALNSCQEEAARRNGVSVSDVRVQHGLDPGNGSYLINYQTQDRLQRIRTGSCRVSPMGEIEDFRN
jgi:hypothetical protein